MGKRSAFWNVLPDLFYYECHLEDDAKGARAMERLDDRKESEMPYQNNVYFLMRYMRE